jgi:hypothetical protein
MPTFVDRAKMTTATTGTGTITLGSAVAGFQTFAAAGVPNAAQVRYVIEDGTNWEVGLGTYTTSGTTLTRGALESTSGGAAITLSGSAIVYVTAAAADLNALAPLVAPTITGLHEVRVAMGANNIDCNAGAVFSKTISGATTLTVSNVPASGTVASFILDLTNGGSAVITWWSGMKWPAATAPSLTASGRDVLGFYTFDGGTTWNGLLLGKGMA